MNDAQPIRLKDLLGSVHLDIAKTNHFLKILHGPGIGYGNAQLFFKLRDGGNISDATAGSVRTVLHRPASDLWLTGHQVTLPEPDLELRRSIEAYWNMYVSVGRFSGTRRSSDESTWIPGTWADLDLKPSLECGFTTSDELDAFITSIAPPTLVVDSGSGGRHPYWLLSGSGLADQKKARELMARWRSLLLVTSRELGKRVDLGVFDLARILRLPGTPRHPKLARHETITTSRMVQLLVDDGPRYSLDDLLILTKNAYGVVRRQQREYRQLQQDDDATRRERQSSRGLGVAMYYDVIRVFEQTQDWAPMLLATGWMLDSDNREHEGSSTAACYWRRPGKTSGGSADTDYGGSNIMYVFSDDPSLDDLFVGPRNGVHNIVGKYRYALIRLYHGDETTFIKDIIAGGGRVL